MGVFEMPSLGADMEAGTLVEWMIKPGDAVKRGDVVAVVETQKGAIEIETFQAGTVEKLTAELGQDLPVGAPLAIILEAGESAGSAAAEPVPKAEPAKTEVPASVVPERPKPAPNPTPVHAIPPSVPSSTDKRVVASPAARQRAAELNIDLADIKGSGLSGAIQLADVEAIAVEPQLEAVSKPSLPMAEMRKAIAATMSRSKREIPHLYVSQTIDLEPAMAWLTQANQGREPAERLLMGALFVRACALAAVNVPAVNGHYQGDAFVTSAEVHTGVAVALRGGGLVAPAILDAHTLDLDATMVAMRDLVSRARAGRLRASEMTGGTITVSALGESGSEAMTAIIFPPQVAVLGIGAPQRRPWVVRDEVVPRQTVSLTLSLDHRVADGRQAARFLTAFDARMQTPEAL